MENEQTAQDIIKSLNLQPHPEGGYYRETFRDSETEEERGLSTAIYYLLDKGQSSHWHRVDAAEIWHFYAGSPLSLKIWTKGSKVEELLLGTDIQAKQRPQIIVPAMAWQAAEAQTGWTLVGCTVAPGFLFSSFEMAPKNWQPDQLRAR